MSFNSYVKKRFLPLLSEVTLPFILAIVTYIFLFGFDLLIASLQQFTVYLLCFAPFAFQWLSEDYQKHKWKWLLEGEKIE
jgi:hypothetical protein